jgi:predicted MFS family arabinose efflux permease
MLREIIYMKDKPDKKIMNKSTEEYGKTTTSQDKSVSFLKRGIMCYMGLIIILILMQIFDSYCMDLQGKLQSFSLKEFLIDKRGMSQEDAVAYINLASLPFLLISALAPAARMLVDKCGKKLIFTCNIILLIFGCLFCFASQSILTYLLGCGIITFCCTLDIQFIYLVEDIPHKYRASLKGLLCGISGLSAICISGFRQIFVSRLNMSWKYIYVAGAVIGAIVLILSLIFLKKRSEKLEADTNSSIEETSVIKASYDNTNITSDNNIKNNVKNSGKLQWFFNDRYFLWMLLNMFVLGMATAGITLSNEPFVAFTGMSEVEIEKVLVIQPVVTIIMHVSSGILADIVGRNKILIGNILMSIVTVTLFVIVVLNNGSVFLIGLLWGSMVGLYFNAESLLQLMIMEGGNKERIGTVSAFITFAYGLGDGIAIFAFSLVVKAAGIGAAKLWLSIPPLVVALIIFIMKNRPIDVKNKKVRD